MALSFGDGSKYAENGQIGVTCSRAFVQYERAAFATVRFFVFVWLRALFLLPLQDKKV